MKQYKTYLSLRFVIPFFLMLGFLLYGNTIDNLMFWDDDDFILNNMYLRSYRYIPSFFTQNLIAGAGLISNYWRPVLLLVFFAEWQVFNDVPYGYHVVNTLFHITNSIFVFTIFSRLDKSKLIAFFVSLFFLIHPLQTEAVTYVNSLGDSLSLFFMVLGLSFIQTKKTQTTPRIKTILISLLYILALLSKETAIIMPGLVFCYALILHTQKKNSHPLHKAIHLTLPLIIIGVLYIILRATVLNFQNTFNLYNEETLFTSHIHIRILTFFKIFWTYLSLLFFPVHLHMERTVAIATTVFSLDVIAGCLAIVLLVSIAFRMRKQTLLPLLGISWMTIALIPTSNIFVPINGLLYEHWLYVPMIGFYTFVFSLLFRIQTRIFQYMIATGIIISMIFFSVQTVRRNNQWQDPITFYTQTLNYAPNSYRILNNLGMAYADTGNTEKAKKYYTRAISLYPEYAVAHHNLGNLYAATAQYEDAQVEYTTAITLQPSFVYSYFQLAKMYIHTGAYEPAANTLVSYIKQQGPNDQIYTLLSEIELKQDNIDMALEYATQALKLNNDNTQAKQLYLHLQDRLR